MKRENTDQAAVRYLCARHGPVRRIPLKPGAEVQAGYTVVAVIDPLTPTLLDARSRTQAEARRDSARANLEKATAAHDFAVRELRRFEKLSAEKAISIQELEPVQWREAAAARDKAAAEGALRQAEAELAEFGTEHAGGAPVAGDARRRRCDRRPTAECCACRKRARES